MEAVTNTVRQLVTSNQPSEYAGMSSFFEGEAPLSQAVGYIVVLGFGAAFSIFTTLLVYLERKHSGGGGITSEQFK
jgi:hypothetical protein